MADRVEKRVSDWGSAKGNLEKEFVELSFEEKLELLVGPVPEVDMSAADDKTFFDEPEIDIVEAVTFFTSKLRKQLTRDGIEVPLPPTASHSANSEFAA